jgi:hypothetical protein
MSLKIVNAVLFNSYRSVQEACSRQVRLSTLSLNQFDPRKDFDGGE